MMSGGRRQQLAGARDAAGGVVLGVARVAPDLRHDGDAGLEAGQAQRQFREDQQARCRRPCSGLPCDVVSASHQLSTATGWREDLEDRNGDSTTTFSAKVEADEEDGDADRLLEAAQEDGAQQGQQEQRDRRRFGPAASRGRTGSRSACAVASAAESVMVIMKSVAAKPSRTRTSSFPPQRGNSRSSMAMEPFAARGSRRPPGGRPAGRPARSRRRARGWRAAKSPRPRALRWPAGSPAWRSSRRRSGTSPATRSAFSGGCAHRRRGPGGCPCVLQPEQQPVPQVLPWRRAAAPKGLPAAG